MKKITKVKQGDVFNPVIHPHDVLQLPDLRPLLGHHHGGSAEVNIDNLNNQYSNLLTIILTPHLRISVSELFC